MKLLFSVNNFGFLRNFEPALRLLAVRGHDIHLVAERRDSVGGERTIANLQRDCPGRITYGLAPSRKHESWQPLAINVRLCLDYWRYLDARWSHSPSLRERAARQAPAFASRLARLPLVGSTPGLRIVRRLFHVIERAIPHGATPEQLLRDHDPDVLLLTPLLYFGSQQVEYVRAARALGIRTVLGVGSWDHLTTKGLIHEQPDRVVVWNDMQRQEASELHGIPADRIAVTGAQAYDQWFTQRPSTSREAFSEKVGVPADRPLLLYLCSSPFITPYEVGFVRRWIAAVRGSVDPLLRDAAILIRPHPQNAGQWKDFDVAAYPSVGIWPRAGANPVDAEARADYYDSMYHSVAVVGVNTSALIESGIVGRPVYTVITDDFAGQQEGTLHFQHLKTVNGGLLHVGRTLDEHVAQLAAALHGTRDVSKSRAFVEAFVRPHGLDVPAAERFADLIEEEARIPRPTAVAPTLAARLLRVLLRPAAAVAHTAALRRRRSEPPRAPAQRPLHFMFVLASPEFLRYYDSTMRLLVTQGHRVSVGVNWLRERKHARLEGLLEDDQIDVLGAMPKRGDIWTAMARAVRGTMDFVRYLDPHFADAPLLRARIHRKVLPAYMRWLDRYTSVSERTLVRVMRVLAACERAVPVSARVRELLAETRPDAVIVSPLIDAASDQVDTVRAAHALGIPAIAAIASWDNLTNKGHMRVQPDLVTVWNEHQKAEAMQLHGVPAERIAVTGAQLFDRWFERQPSRSREAFCASAGLPDTRPFVLFTGSSVFIAPSAVEVPFVRRLIEAMRASADPAVRESAILVRPHPFNGDAWTTADFADLGPVAIWPRGRYTPAAEEARTSFFDSLYFCEAVVGINTSAMIEAAILRKPVLSVLTPEFAGTQAGTLHFRYLLPENGGFLRVASSIEQHIEQLGDALRDPERARAQTEQFVRTFLRPQGLDVPCTPLLASAFERAAQAGPRRPTRDTAGALLLRAVLLPVAAVLRGAALTGDLRKIAYEARFLAVRSFRLALKRGVLTPGRAMTGWTIRRTRAMQRRAGRQVRVGAHRLRSASRRTRHIARRVTTAAALRVLRGVRSARYHLGMRVRGELDPTSKSDAAR